MAKHTLVIQSRWSFHLLETPSNLFLISNCIQFPNSVTSSSLIVITYVNCKTKTLTHSSLKWQHDVSTKKKKKKFENSYQTLSRLSLQHCLTSLKYGGNCTHFIIENSGFRDLVRKEIKPYLWFTETGWHKRTWSHIQIPLFSPTVFWIQCSNSSIQSADNH